LQSRWPLTIAILPYVSDPKGGYLGALVLSHEYCTKNGLSFPSFPPIITVPSGAFNSNVKLPGPPPFAQTILIGTYCPAVKVSLYEIGVWPPWTNGWMILAFVRVQPE